MKKRLKFTAIGHLYCSAPEAQLKIARTFKCADLVKDCFPSRGDG